MLKELRFVQGSVAKKELLPALTHFRIEGGTVRGYNGTLALSTPIPFDIDCKPKAVPLIKAIQNCNETIQLSITKAGRLSIKSGPFKAFIECVPDEDTPHVMPEGDPFELDGEAFLNACKAVSPFIGNDASRPWSTGVLLFQKSAFATNNVILVEAWIGSQFPFTCNIPKAAIDEILRINEPPLYGQSDRNSITFHFSGERWVRSVLLDIAWPNVYKVLERENNAVPFEETFFDGLETLRPFVNKLGAVHFEPDRMCTSLTEGEGATFELPLGVVGCYNIEMLRLLKGAAEKIDFASYPAPCMFFGNNLRGAISGMKPYAT